MDERTKTIDSIVRNHGGTWAAAAAAYEAGRAAERERLRVFAGDTEVVCSLLLSTTNLAATRHALVQQLRDAAEEVLRGPNVAGNRLARQGQSELTGLLGGPFRSEKE